MERSYRRVGTMCLILAIAFFSAKTRADKADNSDLEKVLAAPILPTGTPIAEVQAFCEARVPAVPPGGDAAAWQKWATNTRATILDKIVFRGQAKTWRDAPAKVEWLDTIPGGPGYSIRKLRYEALPGMWIPALLYVPDKLTGRVPVVINFNGHVGAEGKSIGYKQIICINQAKRGMLALNVEWLGMGQLSSEDNAHNRLNQLDLCGTSGLAPFYLLMTRAVDLMLAHANADPTRVAVTGLSGGGWQTIVLSALDPRVTLAAPVAGYSSLRTRARHPGDLGDAEQTPSDFAGIGADYAHLTAMLAPRPALLIYNVKDDCCFASGYALAPLLDAAGPTYEAYGKRDTLRTHVNEVPGTHNYERDNREAFYRMIGDYFFAKDAKFTREEIPCDAELKSAKELNVYLPANNETLHSLAMTIAKDLPRASETGRQRLREVVAFRDYALSADRVSTTEDHGRSVTCWRLKVGNEWTIPAVELFRSGTSPTSTTIFINDKGRAANASAIAKLLDDGKRVVAVDLFSFGECNSGDHAYLYALLVAATGERPLGVETSQLAAVARWQRQEHGAAVSLSAVGPRTSTTALVAAALETDAVAIVETNGGLHSLKQVIEQNHAVPDMPELFCFGLLESFDIPQIAALVAPRSVLNH